MKQEVKKWQLSGRLDGDICDLSFLDAHQAVYVQYHEGREPLEYRFWVTYSPHCFTRDYEHRTDEGKQSLMYHVPRESRPFCQHHCNLTRTHLKRIILALPESNVIHAGYGSCAMIKVDLDGGDKVLYFVALRVSRERERLHSRVANAYSISEKQRDKSVEFFTITYDLLRNKQLPQPSR